MYYKLYTLPVWLYFKPIVLQWIICVICFANTHNLFYNLPPINYTYTSHNSNWYLQLFVWLFYSIQTTDFTLETTPNICFSFDPIVLQINVFWIIQTISYLYFFVFELIRIFLFTLFLYYNSIYILTIQLVFLYNVGISKYICNIFSTLY